MTEDQTIDEQLDEVFEETWADTEARSFDELPDAVYQVRILAAMINNAQTSGRLQCSWENIVLEGESKGRHIFKHDGLDTEDGIAFFKGNLARLGYDEPSSKDGLLELLQEIVDAPTYATMRLSTRKRKVDGQLQEIQNKRYIKALDSDDVEDEFTEDELASTMTGVTEEESTAEEEGEEGYWQKGDRVSAKVEGEMYPGKVKKLKDETAIITFDDGDELEVSYDDLEEVEVKKEEKKSKKKSSEKKEKEEEEPGCELKKTKLTPPERRIVKKLAKENKFNPDDYDTLADLLCQLGDYHGLEGKFTNPAAMIKAIRATEE